jgi:phosphopantetheinyl transferase
MSRIRILTPADGLRVAIAPRPTRERSAPGDSAAFWAGRVAPMLGYGTASLEIRTLPGRAPRAVGDGRAFGLSFARTIGARACAVTPDGAVGVDIERMALYEELDAMIRIALTDREAGNCPRGDREERALAFLMHWTAKEAVLKAVGVGLGREPRSVEVEPRPGWTRARHAGREFRVWSYRTRHYVIAAATPINPAD